MKIIKIMIMTLSINCFTSSSFVFPERVFPSQIDHKFTIHTTASETSMSTLSAPSDRWGGDGEAARSWSDLPEGPLDTVLNCICSLVDLISFKSVCRSWRAVASSLSASVIRSRFPPLLIFPKLSDGRLSGFGLLDPASPSFCSSLSCSSDRLDKFRLNLDDSGVDYFCRTFCSHGHLLCLLGNRFVVINLFTGDEFYSPTFPEDGTYPTQTGRVHFDPESCVLTSPLSSPDSGLLALTLHGPMYYWRIGSASWSSHWPRDGLIYILSIVTIQEKVYAMNSLGYCLFVLEFSPKFHMRPINVIKRDHFYLQDDFLVDCGDQLLHVGLSRDWNLGRLEAFQLDLSVNGPRWVKKETLGNWAIFAGMYPQLRGLAVENPERWGGRSNCVYFNRLDQNRDSPFAVFKLGDEIDLSDGESSPFPSHHANPEFQQLSEWLHPGI